MCIYTHGSRVFMIARVNLPSLAARLTTVSLDTADFPVFTNIDITVGFKTHFITMASNSYDFVIIIYKQLFF